VYAASAVAPVERPVAPMHKTYEAGSAAPEAPEAAGHHGSYAKRAISRIFRHV
jgi:hypothetical protein